MLVTSIIGYLGADAEYKGDQGREFITFRVSHTDRWTDQAGQLHESTQWIDCIMNGRPKVAEFLKKGTCVYVDGRMSTRVYSSAKDRCMKAGVTISVNTIELVGGKGDDVPSRLYDENGVQHDIKKYYWTDIKGGFLMNPQGRRFAVDDSGWVFPLEQAEQMMQKGDAAETQGPSNADAATSENQSNKSAKKTNK